MLRNIVYRRSPSKFPWKIESNRFSGRRRTKVVSRLVVRSLIRAIPVRIMQRLSEHDKAVLNVIFDPLQLMGSRFSSYENSEDSGDLTNCEKDNLPEDVTKIIERAIEASEKGNFEEAFELFDKARTRAPRSSVVLNDRAQALRLVGRDDDALKDLNLAVELSKGRGNAGIKALCQRGVLHRCAGRTEEARQDFELAARGGSSFARTQLVNLNPYAAMCNAMLRDISVNSLNS